MFHLINSFPEYATSPIKRQRLNSPSQKLISFNLIENLPEYILDYIFFSGYLETMFILNTLPSVCRLFNKVVLHTQHINLKGYEKSICPIKIKALCSFEKLRYLDLGYTEIDDLFITQLQDRYANSLQSLSIRGTWLTDGVLNKIGSFQQLIQLDISKSTSHQMHLISDGIKNLYSLSKLTWINLSMTDVDDGCINILAKHSKLLKYIGLSCCLKITDKSLEYLNKLKLIILDLSGDNITDDGITYLADP